MIRELDYERSTTAPTTPLVTPAERPASLSGLVLLIGGLLALGAALTYIGGASQAQAVAWAFVVAGVLAALDRWA